MGDRVIRTAIRTAWRWLTTPYSPPPCPNPGCTLSDPCDDCRWRQVGGL